MSTKKDIVQISREIHQQRLSTREKLQQESISSISVDSIVFPSFSFKDTDTYVRAFPWKYNGFILHLGPLTIVVDPGVDFLSRCLFSHINMMQPNTLFVSHAHLDHYAGASSLIETMASENTNKKIRFIASKEFYKQRVISNWHLNKERGGLPNVESLTAIPHKRIVLDTDTQLIPIPLIHTIKGAIGFIILHKNLKIGYISDTGYTKTFRTSTDEIYRSGDQYDGTFKEIISKHEYIKNLYNDMDYLICNIKEYTFTKHSKTHLSGYDIIDIIKESKNKKCIITHINQFDLTDNLYSKMIAEEIQSNSGIQTVTVQENGYVLELV